MQTCKYTCKSAALLGRKKLTYKCIEDQKKIIKEIAKGIQFSETLDERKWK
jgi:hypothetical protein